MGLDTLLLNFYGLNLIHFTDPLSQVVQTVNVWYAIYIYIYKRKKGRVAIPFCSVSLWDWEETVRTNSSEHILLGVAREESQLNPRLISFTNWGHLWTSDEYRNGFLWNQLRPVFLNSQFILLYALMSFMRSWLWFQFFNMLILEDLAW